MTAKKKLSLPRSTNSTTSSGFRSRMRPIELAKRREVGDRLVVHPYQEIAGRDAILVAAHSHRRLDHDHALLIGLEKPGGDVSRR